MNTPEEPAAPPTRTHRDTFAFVLVMGGMTMWALFPAVALVHGNSRDDEQSILALALFIGCLAGAGVAASVFRGAALTTAAVAGAVTAALSIGSVHYVEHRAMPALDGFAASIVMLTTIAAAAGAVLGKRIAPRRDLAAAGIVMGAVGATLALLGLVDPSESSSTGTVLLALVIASPLLGATVAAVLCAEVRPGAVAIWTFVLFASAAVIIYFAVSKDNGRSQVLFGGVFVAGVVAAAVAVPTLVVNALRRPRTAPTVPVAKVSRSR